MNTAFTGKFGHNCDAALNAWRQFLLSQGFCASSIKVIVALADHQSN
jgi:hypothetical protein